MDYCNNPGFFLIPLIVTDDYAQNDIPTYSCLAVAVQASVNRIPSTTDCQLYVAQHSAWQIAKFGTF